MLTLSVGFEDHAFASGSERSVVRRRYTLAIPKDEAAQRQLMETAIGEKSLGSGLLLQLLTSLDASKPRAQPFQKAAEHTRAEDALVRSNTGMYASHDAQR